MPATRLILSEILAEHDLSQYYLAESLQFPLVTIGLNNGRRERLTNETWELIPSPESADYTNEPELALAQVAGRLEEIIEDEDNREDVLSWAKRVEKGKWTVEEFEEKVNDLIN